MSSSCVGTDYLPAGIAIFGGIPSHSDVGPSALFIALYALLIPVGLWRATSPKSRTWILFRPNLFIYVRLATFIVRLVQAECNFSVGTFIAELILELSGFNIICEPLVRVLEQNLHASAYNNGIEEPNLIVRILKLMRLGLLVSFILGIYTGTQYSGDLTPDEVSTLDQYRLATSGINVGVVGLAIVFSVMLHRAYRCSTRATLFVLAVGCMLIIPSSYRLYNVVDGLPNTGARTKVYFYVLGAMFEFFSTVAFFAVNLRDVFDLDYKHPGEGGPIGMVIGRVSQILGRKEHVNPPPKFVQASTGPSASAYSPAFSYAGQQQQQQPPHLEEGIESKSVEKL